MAGWSGGRRYRPLARAPHGYGGRPAGPAGVYDKDMREFLLPYEAVAGSADPDATLLEFRRATHAAAGFTD